MDMSSMSGMNMATTTASGTVAAATSSMHSGHGTMDMSGTMTMAQMLMVFFTATNTPLFSLAWTPDTVGEYAGTCIFLIVLAAILRGLLALRSNFDSLWAASTRNRDVNVLRQHEEMGDLKRTETMPARPVVTRKKWRVGESATRAFLDTILAGVSYLLMLAVMTMNVGYFLSVLGGVFLGSFMLGCRGGSTVSH